MQNSVYPTKDPGVVIFLFTNTFIILPKTSYVGPESSFVILPSYFVFISSLKMYNKLLVSVILI